LLRQREPALALSSMTQISARADAEVKFHGMRWVETGGAP
jgi:hypothetical protein